MCEPLSVRVYACRRAEIGPEENVLILRAGPIGLVSLLAARAFGSPRIVVVDVDDYRLQVAKKLGTHITLKVTVCRSVPKTVPFHAFLSSGAYIFVD
jgi:L-iditol 2-dehydrogenase